MAERDDLMLQRGRLLLRSAQLRAQFAVQLNGLRRPLHLADQAREGVQWLVRNPQWPLGVLAVVVVLRPRRVLRIASLLWWGVGMAQRVRRVAASLGTQIF